MARALVPMILGVPSQSSCRKSEPSPDSELARFMLVPMLAGGGFESSRQGRGSMAGQDFAHQLVCQ